LKTASPHPAQRDHTVGVERQEAHREGEHEQPVRDLLAEARAGGPLGIDVLRVRVAGEVGELEDVRLAHRSGPAVSNRSPSRELVERALEEASGQPRPCRPA
jgi:hypothetical protein